MEKRGDYWQGRKAVHRRALLKAAGYEDEDLRNKPHIGVANTFMEGSPGTAHLRQVAEYYLDKLPEIYFMKTEIAAAVRSGEDRMAEIRKTENVCLSTLTAMLALRIEEQDDKKLAKEYMKNAEEIMTLYEKFEDQKTMAGMLKKKIKDGTLLDFYK